MKTKADLQELHLTQYGVPAGQDVDVGYKADPLKIETAPFIVERLISWLRPSNHLDLGCGTGLYVEEFRRQGVESRGIEGNVALDGHLRTEPDRVRFEDLRSVIADLPVVDLVTCIEVVEHIEEDYVEALLENLTRPAGKWLVATTGISSGGTNPYHKNEQPADYWISRLVARNFVYEVDLSRRLMQEYRRLLDGRGLDWWGKCLAVFRNPVGAPQGVRSPMRAERWPLWCGKLYERALSAGAASDPWKALSDPKAFRAMESKYPIVDVRTVPEDFVLGIFTDYMGKYRSYVRACGDLGVRYQVIDLLGSGWMRTVRDSACAGFIAHPTPGDSTQRALFEERLQIVCDELGRPVWPLPKETWFYESKRRMAYWLQAHGVPHPETHVFHREDEALAYLAGATFPMVCKTDLGSGAAGVWIIRGRSEAEKIVQRAFRGGLRRQGAARGERERGFVLFQQYVDGAQEYRVIQLGESWFGHEKVAGGRRGLHSGSGESAWSLPPEGVWELCWGISRQAGFRTMNYDVFVQSDGTALVNEMQVVFASYNPSQMYVEGKPGRYRRVDGEWLFEEGLFNRNGSANARVETFVDWLLSRGRGPCCEGRIAQGNNAG